MKAWGESSSGALIPEPTAMQKSADVHDTSLSPEKYSIRSGLVATFHSVPFRDSI
jgi:hypothetical protein